MRGSLDSVPHADPVEGEGDEQQADDGMGVVLEGAAARVLGSYPVDDGAERWLREVENEYCDAEFLNEIEMVFFFLDRSVDKGTGTYLVDIT